MISFPGNSSKMPGKKINKQLPVQLPSDLQFKVTNEKYKKKFKCIKRLARELIFENAALCDHIAILQEKTLALIEERNSIFKKLQQYHPIAAETESLLRPGPAMAMLGESPLPVKKPLPKKRSILDLESGKVKAMKKTPVAKKKKMVKPVPSDALGKPIFPVMLADFSVHSLGEVSEKIDYHTEDIIYPIGYCSSRIYGSIKDPEKQAVYTCKVLDGGATPKFEIVSNSDYDMPLVSSSIDHCHSMLLKYINNALGTEVVNVKGRGAEFFGLSHPTVQYLIQGSPGVRKCKKYVWTKFEVNPNYEFVADETEASISYSALLRSISFSKSHLDSMVKREPASDYSDDNVAALRSLLMSQMLKSLGKC